MALSIRPLCSAGRSLKVDYRISLRRLRTSYAAHYASLFLLRDIFRAPLSQDSMAIGFATHELAIVDLLAQVTTFVAVADSSGCVPARLVVACLLYARARVTKQESSLPFRLRAVCAALDEEDRNRLRRLLGQADALQRHAQPIVEYLLAHTAAEIRGRDALHSQDFHHWVETLLQGLQDIMQASLRLFPVAL